jgi:3-hydroxyisobutyrate dehydrogenase-like beta-hydroxyacid dehydrogenase
MPPVIHLSAYNRTPEKTRTLQQQGIHIASTAAEAIAAAEVVILLLADATAIRTVLFDSLHQRGPSRAHDHSNGHDRSVGKLLDRSRHRGPGRTVPRSAGAGQSSLKRKRAPS